MNTLREAATMALEALKNAIPELQYMASGMTHAAWKTAQAQKKLDEARAAIKAAEENT